MQANSTNSLLESCDLCGAQVNQHSVQNGDLTFCCIGCQTVYQILETRNELDQRETHPLFEQALRTGIISNPTLLETFQKHPSDLEWTRWVFEVGGLWCPACSEVIRLFLMQEGGVRKCVVDYATDIAVVEFAPMKLSKERICNRLERLGYSVHELEDIGDKNRNKSLIYRLGVSTFCAMNIMMFSYPIYIGYFVPELTGYTQTLSWLACITSIPVVTYCSWPIFQRFVSSLRIGYLGMEALVAIGVVSAFALSTYNLLKEDLHIYFDSMSMIVVLVLLGKWIETKAKASAKNTLLRLSQSIPKRCRRKIGDKEAFVKIAEMQKDDFFVVLAGEKIPLDGSIVEGSGTCDESVMTGESMPIYKKIDDDVLAGTVLVQGNIVAQVCRTSEQTALSRIVDIVSHNLDQKSETIPLVDQIVRWFVPLVIILAAATAYFNGFIDAIAVLLIACPCAIGIAAPLADALTINRLAELGVIVRNRRVLQWLGKEDHFFFDKTGTVTKGEFKLVEGLGKLTARERAVLKSMAMRSTHPLCKSLNQEMEDAPVECEYIEEVVGRGMRCLHKGDEYRFGSAAFVGLENEGVLFTKNGELIAPILFEDEIKQEMLDFPLDIPVTLLSGDRKKIVEKVASDCGFDWVAEVTPLQKKEVVDRLVREKKIVGMVGDGINDAPALSAAHVSVSVLTASDISIQVSDLLLTSDNMNALVKMRKIAQRGRRIMKQNLFWAFFYNVIGLGLAITGYMTPVYATGAMILSSLFVVGNVKGREGRNAFPLK